VTDRQIVAVGGGPFGEQLRDYVLGLTVRRPPRVLWVGTASAEDPLAALRIHDLYGGHADVTRLEFFPWPPAGLRELALDQDVIVVGGGNTANMLAIWRVHAFDRVLREAWEAGVVLTGTSAGMICWFESGVTDSFGPQLGTVRDGLGFLQGSCCPHYDDEELRRPVYRDLVDRGELRRRPARGRRDPGRQAGLPGGTRRRDTTRRDAAFVSTYEPACTTSAS
jgi:peptidase E